MTASLFVSKLLTRVADTEDRNLRTLSVIVQRFLADSPELYLKAQMKVGLRYIMTRPQLREFIRRTGFEKWYQSTTLSMSAAGNLVFDVPRSVQPVRSQQHIAELFGATMTQVRVVIKRPVMHRKDEFYPMTEAQLVEVLIIARNAAYKLPSWQYANAPAAEAGPPALSTDAQKAFPTATRKRRDPSAP